MMGTYYFAVDDNTKSYFYPPRGNSPKFPQICRYDNPFMGMFGMMKIIGECYYIVCDVSYELPNEYEDKTEEIYSKYRNLFPGLDGWVNKPSHYLSRLNELRSYLNHNIDTFRLEECYNILDEFILLEEACIQEE